MKQCDNCKSFISDLNTLCIYCKNDSLKSLKFKNDSVGENYKIYSHEIVANDQAYTILKTLGKGGFGTVLKVFSPKENRYFAAKVPLTFDELFTNNKGNRSDNINFSEKLLKNEIETFDKYQDEAFLYIFEKGNINTFSIEKHKSFPFYLMELAECTIKDIIKSENDEKLKISFSEKIKIIREILNSLSILHDMNIVHRDLSPDNLFAVDRGGKISYVLGDFGTSKRLYETDNSNKHSVVIGHTAYLDPARFDEDYSNDFRIDIYSLGIIITEILMEKFWIKLLNNDTTDNLAAIDFEKDFLLKDGSDHIDHGFIQVIRKAITRNPQERYSSIDQFRKALFKYIEESTIYDNSITSSITSPNVNNEIRTILFNLNFHIKFPLSKTETTFSQEVITYQKEKDVTLTDYRGAKIIFNNFIPKKANIMNTSFYSITIIDKSLLLNFKNSVFNKKLKEIDKIKSEISGEIQFHTKIEIHGVIC